MRTNSDGKGQLRTEAGSSLRC